MEKYGVFKLQNVFVFSVTSHESRELSLIVNVNIDVVVNVISSGQLRSKFGVDDPNNVMSVNALNCSPVTSAVKVTLVSSSQLLLEKVDMSLRDWVNCGKDIPVNRLAARRGCHGSLVDVSVIGIDHVHQISVCNQRLHWIVGLGQIN